MESSGGDADASSHILIQNNTYSANECFGIRVRGTADVNNAGQVTLVNNIVSSSQTGIALVNGWMYPVVTNTGYYANITNINDFNDTNSVEVNEGPYVDGQNIFEVCYLKQDCPFIDAGWGYVEETAMIGMTTDYYNSLPDSNKVDIGFHHPNWDYAENYLIWLWDFDDSGQIDISDFQVFAEYWLNPFDFYDFASFASQYGQTSQQLTPDIQMVFNQDTNSLKGFVQIGVDVFDPNMNRLFVLMDGEKYSEIFDLDNLTTGVQTGTFANGKHSFKVVRLKNNGDIICSGPYDVNFSNEISCITADSGYSSDRGYCFYAFGSVGENYNAEIRNLVNDNIVYTSNFNDNIGVRAAASVFTEPYHIYSVTVTDANSDEIAKKIMGRRFNPNVIDGGVKMAVTIGSEDVNTWGNLDNIVPAVIKAAVGQELNPQYLPYEDCTWKNLSRLLKDYPNVTYWYHIGHGSYKIPVVSHSDPNLSVNVRRTWIGIKDNMVFSRLKKDYGAGVPPNYQDLGSWESYASIAELGFESNPKLEYVRIYSCYSAKYPDFAVAAGIINDIYYNPLGDRIYIGWKNAAYPGDWNWKWGIVPIPIYYKTFEVSWFYQQGVGYSVGKAVTEAIMAQPLVIRCILWNGLYPNIGFWGANEFYFWFGQ